MHVSLNVCNPKPANAAAPWKARALQQLCALGTKVGRLDARAAPVAYLTVPALRQSPVMDIRCWQRAHLTLRACTPEVRQKRGNYFSSLAILTPTTCTNNLSPTQLTLMRMRLRQDRAQYKGACCPL